MNQPDDNEIEGLLRAQFEGPIRDDGFSERVMQRLPRHRRRAAWPLWTGILAGIGECWLSLLPASLLPIGWRNWVGGELSASAIILMSVVAGMSVLACCWTIMESEDY